MIRDTGVDPAGIQVRSSSSVNLQKWNAGETIRVQEDSQLWILDHTVGTGRNQKNSFGRNYDHHQGDEQPDQFRELPITDNWDALGEDNG